MCGIAGYIGKKKIDKDRVNKTLSLMVNRGPDCQDSKIIEDGALNIALLHSRLSIIDLDKRSNQPFIIGDYYLIFNGEIYNYKELREKLEGKGVKFLTESDTEVLLRSYMEYGESCVEQFEGMWSFAIYDKKEKKLFLSRDRFAEKPLYFLRSEEGFFFASEIKFIASLLGRELSINEEHILRYLINGYKSLYKGKETFFKDIEELPYASNMVVKKNLKPSFQRYWKPICAPQKMALEEAIDGFRHHLLKSIKIRLRADVPLAFCLSGGIDSSTIVSAAVKCFQYDAHTFSIIDSDERYNESDNIKATVDDLGCKHTFIDVSKENFLPRLEKLIGYHDCAIKIRKNAPP